ncbi:hypothetical protein PUN28_020788 [Cardiocondyla obscurior]|uniref:Nucleoprotein n=1 Tax=Cardiocondyla obscurior TaxID=286306 RepID=A0AAW2E7X7_9HYME
MGLIKYDRAFQAEEEDVGRVYANSNWILTSRELESHNIILTAVSWLLGERSDKTDLVNLAISVTDPENPDNVCDYTRELEQLDENPATQQCKLYMRMAGIMTLAKELRTEGPTANADYLLNRWKAFCASINLADHIELGTITRETIREFNGHIIIWQSWIKTQQKVRVDILNSTLRTLPADTNKLHVGIVSQVRMVLQNYGMRSILTMCNFISSQNKAIIIPTVARQACELYTAYTELRQKNGALSPFIRVFPLEGAERLNHRNYPDLYYVSVQTAARRGDLGKEGQYIITDVTTETSKSILDRYSKKSLRMDYKVTPEVTDYLSRCGVSTQELITRRSRNETDTEDEEEATRGRNSRRVV